jgi:hypothetical protein
MNHILQSEAECYPTTIAMLSNQPVKKVIQTLLRDTPYNTWQEMMVSSTFTRIDVFDHVTRIIHRNAQSILPWISTKALRAFPTDQPVGLSLSPLALSGRGTITVRKPGAGHVVAFENNMIYDPGISAPINWRLWKMLHDMSGAKVVDITVDPESIRHEETKEAEETESEVSRYPHSENW